MKLRKFGWNTLLEMVVTGEIQHDPAEHWANFNFKRTICPHCGFDTTRNTATHEQHGELGIAYVCYACEIAYDERSIQDLSVVQFLLKLTSKDDNNE